MSGIFLEPEATFSVTVTGTAPDYKVEDGTSITLRTATGREYAALMSAFRSGDDARGYDLLPRHIVSGVDSVDRLHPNVVALLLVEVVKRSHLSETAAGN